MRYSDADLEEFEGILRKKLKEASQTLATNQQTLSDPENEINMKSDDPVEQYGRNTAREDIVSVIDTQSKFIKHVNNALLRIENKTYGICRVTGKLIQKERLLLVPHATLSIEAKRAQD